MTLILVTVTGNAQQKQGKSVFAANAGVSVPINEFALKTFRYDAGFASPGPSLGVEYLYYGKIFGFSSGISYSGFFFNEKAYLAEYDRVMGGYGINDVSAGNYQVLNFLVGFTLKLPEISQTEVMLLMHFGAAVCIHPEVIVTNTVLGEINTIARSGDNTPVSNATLKINYWLNDNYGLSLNAGVSSALPWFRDETSIEKNFSLPVHFVNINAGFVMGLNRPAQ